MACDHQRHLYVHQLYLLQRHMIGRANGYEKRVHHDQVVPKALFQDTYMRLRPKYEHWMTQWSEKTDPRKYVTEDICIAAYLIALWGMERKESGRTT